MSTGVLGTNRITKKVLPQDKLSVTVLAERQHNTISSLATYSSSGYNTPYDIPSLSKPDRNNTDAPCTHGTGYSLPSAALASFAAHDICIVRLSLGMSASFSGVPKP